MGKFNGLTCGMVLALAGFAHAQVETTTTTTTAPNGTTEIRRVSQLIGSNVALQGRDNFGKIEDVVLNENGTPGYLVVSNGGRYAMLPFNEANINYGRRMVTYNVTPQAVQPLFLPRTRGRTWRTSSTRPGCARSSRGRVRCAGKS